MKLELKIHLVELLNKNTIFLKHFLGILLISEGEFGIILKENLIFLDFNANLGFEILIFLNQIY
jgi:hypothetical protein